MLGADLRHQIAGDDEFVIAAALDFLEETDAAQQMLVHRVVVVHVELHHRHDLAERADEVAQHAGFVHPPQHGLGVVGCQNLHEQPVRLGIVAQLRIDQRQRTRRGAQGIRVECEVVGLRQPEHADQVDRIALEHIERREIDAIVVDDEIVAAAETSRGRRPQPRHHPRQRRCGLGLLIFELGAQDRGEVADILCDQEVVLHEALDVLHPRMRGVAESLGDIALGIEGETLLGAAAEEMQIAAHRPQEILAAAEGAIFLRVEHAVRDELVGIAHAVDVLGDPEQRVQVAKAALAVLDVGLDEITRLAGAA